MKNIIACFLLCYGLISSFSTLAAIKETVLFTSFVNKMVNEHQFDAAELKKLFQSVEIKKNILKTMARPAEGLPWYKYRKIFMTDTSINGGVKFWQENAQALTAVETKYGIPAEIITAIIGVETRYGKNTGHHRVIDALSTLAFSYPKRSKFFISELKHFLILCREEKMNPLEPTGSYAGAMGIPQFMPSSYRTYAADFEGDEKRDIWNNPFDAIASVANYFVKHHWQRGEAIVFPANAESQAYQQALTKGLKPDYSWGKLQALAVYIDPVLKQDEAVKLLSYEQKTGNNLWVALNNFYVITRYNHSPLYAMAVYQLSDAINKKIVDEAAKKAESNVDANVKVDIEADVEADIKRTVPDNE